MNALVVNYAIDDETTCRGYAVSSVKACSCTRIFYGEIGIKRCLVFKAGASVIMGGSEQTQRGLRTTVLVRSGKFMPSLLPVTAEAVGSSPVVPDIPSKTLGKDWCWKLQPTTQPTKASALLHSSPHGSGINLALPEFRPCLPACRDPKLSGFSREAGCFERSSVLLNPPQRFGMPACVVSTSKSQ